MKIVPQAISWKTRTIKVAGEWAKVADNINFLLLRIGQKYEIDVSTTLDGSKLVERIYT